MHPVCNRIAAAAPSLAGVKIGAMNAGPILFGLLTAGLAIGAAVTFSAASLFLIFPLIAGAFMIGGLGFGLSAGAFVLSGIVASVFNLVHLHLI